jgi:peptidoglycan/xylan/chitin deacetylase (PgdA/CDA1 family)
MAGVQIPILMYHSIGESGSPPFCRYAVSLRSFEAQVRFLRDNGYRALTVSGLVQALDGQNATLPKRPVVLTFDDGFADFYEVALPVLARHGVTATLYVVSGAVGGTSEWLSKIGEGGRRIVTWSQLADIERSGIEVGAHSVTHAALDLLPLDRARGEIAGCKRALEDALGCQIASFAYPFGYQNANVRRIVQEGNFSSACVVRYGMSSPSDDRFALPRYLVHDNWDAESLAAVLEGRPPLISNLYQRARSRAWGAVRRSVQGFYQ